MTTTAVTNLGGLDIGKYLKIISKGGVYNNLPEDSAMWENIQKKKKGTDEGRELRYLLRSAYGAAAANFIAIGGSAFPNAQKSGLAEGNAQYKDFALTLEVQRDVIARAVSDFSRYGEPLAEEIRAKTITLSRQLSAAVYADGTGVLAQVSAAAAVASNRYVVTVSSLSTAKGFIGWLEMGDRVVVATTAGVQTDPTVTGTFAFYSVYDKDRAAGTVTLEPQNSTGTALATTVSNITAGMYILKSGSQLNDWASVSTSNDYNSLSNYFPGLQSLAAADGRLVNGINMTGAIKGSKRDAGGAPIDSSDFQRVLSQIKLNVGTSRYKYNRAMMAFETLDALIESRETDRRFTTISDNKRGVEGGMAYVHGKDSVALEADEFCPFQSVWFVPEGDVLQFWGADFEFVEPQAGQKFFLKPNASGHDNVIRSYMMGHGTLTCVHPAAIGEIKNFTVGS